MRRPLAAVLLGAVSLAGLVPAAGAGAAELPKLPFFNRKPALKLGCKVVRQDDAAAVACRWSMPRRPGDADPTTVPTGITFELRRGGGGAGRTVVYTGPENLVRRHVGRARRPLRLPRRARAARRPAEDPQPGGRGARPAGRTTARIDPVPVPTPKPRTTDPDGEAGSGSPAEAGSGAQARCRTRPEAASCSRDEAAARPGTEARAAAGASAQASPEPAPAPSPEARSGDRPDEAGLRPAAHGDHRHD